MRHIKIKLQNTKDISHKKILKAAGGKRTAKSKRINRINANFSSVATQTRRQWNIFLNEKSYQFNIIYPVKTSSKNEHKTKINKG